MIWHTHIENVNWVDFVLGFFMGNCIGERNQLNFFLFLFFASIVVAYNLILSVISFVENLIEHGDVFAEFYYNTPLFIVFVVLVGSSILISICDGCEKAKEHSKVLAGLMMIFSFIWILATNPDLIFYRNPVIPLLGILFYLFSSFVVFPRMLYNGFLACIGSTLKQ